MSALLDDIEHRRSFTEERASARGAYFQADKWAHHRPARSTADSSVAATPLIRVFATDSRPMVLRGLSESINALKPLMEVVGVATSYAQTIELVQRLRPEVVVFSFFPDGMNALDVLATLIDGCGANVLILKERDDPAPIGKAIELGARGVVLAEDRVESIVQAIIQASHLTDGAGKAWIGDLAHLGAPAHLRVRGSQDRKLTRLTARELELIGAIMENPSAKYMAIGGMLGISEHTVHNHLTSIYQKLAVVNRIELLVYAVRNRIGGLQQVAG